MVVKKQAPVPYHPMIRFLAGIDLPQKNVFTAATVDAHIAEWVAKGYEVAFTSHAGRMPYGEGSEAAEGIYILFKYVG